MGLNTTMLKRYTKRRYTANNFREKTGSNKKRKQSLKVIFYLMTTYLFQFLPNLPQLYLNHHFIFSEPFTAEPRQEEGQIRCAFLMSVSIKLID